MRAAHKPWPKICCTVCALVNARFLSICWTCARTAPISGSGLPFVHDESGERRVLLAHGEVRGGLGIFADLSHDRGSDDADHLEQLWFFHDCEALSERFLARPDGLGHCFIDDGYARGLFTIEIREVAAADERNTHGFQMAGGHVVKVDEGAAIIRVGLFAFAKDGA